MINMPTRFCASKWIQLLSLLALTTLFHNGWRRVKEETKCLWVKDQLLRRESNIILKHPRDPFHYFVRNLKLKSVSEVDRQWFESPPDTFSAFWIADALISFLTSFNCVSENKIATSKQTWSCLEISQCKANITNIINNSCLLILVIFTMTQMSVVLQCLWPLRALERVFSSLPRCFWPRQATVFKIK